ncbi:MAG: tRNA-dihydrouridine synthase family protein [Eubacterium sp.]|nr:tRNA-dihydrouridine synthase family protein [Eubacterium sp.]
MNYYFAPLEGITRSIFRNCYERFFGGIDAYYTPFVTTRDGGIMKKKEKRDILPENNSGLNIIPQIMTNKSEEFLQAARHMQEMGYTEVNLNLGCPSGTVVPKGKGSGFLRDTDALDRFLEEIYNGCPIDISIKSRIGFSSPEELPVLLEIYNKYPVKMLILHLRTREEMYSGSIHPEAFSYAYDNARMPLVFNGDVKTVEDVKLIKNSYSNELKGIMIGRGFLSHPGFVGNEKLKGNYTDKNRIMEFIRALEDDYSQVLFGETPLLFKMKEIWSFLQESFTDGDRLFRKIKKVKHLDEYHRIISTIDK